MNNEYSITFRALGADQFSSDVRRMVQALEQMAQSYDNLLRKMQQSYRNATAQMNHPGAMPSSLTSPLGSTAGTASGSSSLDAQYHQMMQTMTELPAKMEAAISRSLGRSMGPSGGGAAVQVTGAAELTEAAGYIARGGSALVESAAQLTRAGTAIERMSALGRSSVPAGMERQFEGTLQRIVQEMGRAGMGVRVPSSTGRYPAEPTGQAALRGTPENMAYQTRLASYNEKAALRGQYEFLERQGLASGGYMIPDPRLAATAINAAATYADNPTAMPGRGAYYRMANVAAAGGSEDELLASLMTSGGGGRGAGTGVGGLRSFLLYGGRRSHITSNLLQTGLFGAGAALGYGALNLLGTNFTDSLQLQYKQMYVDQLIGNPQQAGRFNAGVTRAASRYSVPPTEAYDVAFKMRSTFGDNGDALKATNSVLLLARTSTIQLTQAMSDLVAITDSFQTGAKGMGDTVNGLIGIQNKYGVSTEQMVQSLARLGDLMHELGIDEAHAAAYVGVIQRSTGASGEQVASKIERVLPRFMDPTAQGLLAQIGVRHGLFDYSAFESGAPNVQDLIQKISGAYTSHQISKNEITQIGVALGQQRNMAYLAPLLEKSPEINGMAGAFLSGAANEAAVKRWNTLSGSAEMALKGVESSIMSLAQEIAQSGLIQAFTYLMDAIKHLSDFAGGLIHIFNSVTASLGEFGNVLKGALAGYLGYRGVRGVVHAGGGLGSAFMTSQPVVTVRRLVSSEGLAEGEMVSTESRKAAALRKLEMAAAGTAGPGFVGGAPIFPPGTAGAAYYETLIGGSSLQAMAGPARSLYLAPDKEATAIASPGLMKAFGAGIKSTTDMFTSLIVKMKDFGLALLAPTREMAGGFLGKIFGTGGRLGGLLGPAGEGQVATGLRGWVESQYVKRMMAGGAESGTAIRAAGALTGGEALSFLGGAAVPYLAAAGVAYMGYNAVHSGMLADRQSDREFKRAIAATADQVSGFSGRPAGLAGAADILEQAAQSGDTHAQTGSSWRHLGRFLTQSNTLSTLTYAQALALGVTKKQFEQADIAIGTGGNAGGYRANASSIWPGVQSAFGAPTWASEYQSADTRMPVGTAKKLSKILRQKEADEQTKTFKNLMGQGLGASLLPPELLAFMASDIQSNYQYGGTALDVMGTSSGGQPAVASKKYTFKDYIKRLGDNITAVQAEIDDAIKANNVSLAQQLEDTKNQMMAQKVQVQNQADQSAAALVSYTGSILQGTAAQVAAAQNAYNRVSDKNSPEGMDAKLKLDQAIVAQVQAPYQLSMSASSTLGSLTPNNPMAQYAQLQQQANASVQQAQATLALFGGNPNNNVVQQAMTQAIAATSGALQALDQAQLQAIQAAGNLAQSQTRDPVSRARISLRTAQEVYSQTLANVNRENALAGGTTGNPIVDKFIKDLQNQSNQTFKNDKDASSQLQTAGKSLQDAATLWQTVGNDILAQLGQGGVGAPASGSSAFTGGAHPGQASKGHWVYDPDKGHKVWVPDPVSGGGGAMGTGVPNVSAHGLTLTKFMAGIRQEESGGNYSWGLTSSAGAHGAYQFMPATWLADARAAGVNPNDHSKAAQDKVAAFAMKNLFKHYGGDWFKVAEAWYQGQGATDKGQNNAFGGLSATQYAHIALSLAGKPGLGPTSNVNGGSSGNPSVDNAAAAVNDAKYQLATAIIEQFMAGLLQKAGAASQPTQLRAQIVGLRAKIRVDKSFGDITAMYQDMAQLQNDAYQLAQERVQAFYDALQLRTDTTNPVVSLQDQIRMLDKQMQAYLRNGGKKTDDAYIQMALQKRNDVRDKALAKTQNMLTDEDYAFAMHQVGWEQHIQNLMHLRDTINTKTRAGKLLWEQINQEIQGLVDSLSGQFNLPDLGKFMPTVYEARRGAALAKGVYAPDQHIPIPGSSLTASGTASRLRSTSGSSLVAPASGLMNSISETMNGSHNTINYNNKVIINVHGGNTQKIIKEIKAALNVEMSRWGSVTRKSW